MAIEPYYLGETWTFDLVLNDRGGNPIDLTDATIEIRIADLDGTLLLTRSTVGGNITVTDAAAGQATTSVQPDDQVGFTAPGQFILQTHVVTSDGAVSVQTEDILPLKKMI